MSRPPPLQAVRDAPIPSWRTPPGDDTASANFAESHAHAMRPGPAGVEDRRDIWVGLSLMAPRTAALPAIATGPKETDPALSPGPFRNAARDWFGPAFGGSFRDPRSSSAMRPGAGPLHALCALWLPK